MRETRLVYIVLGLLQHTDTSNSYFDMPLSYLYINSHRECNCSYYMFISMADWRKIQILINIENI